MANVAADLDTLLVCPACHGALDWTDATITCRQCGAQYVRHGEIPVMLPIAESDRAVAELDAHKAHQASFYDEEDPEFEITRPHGTPDYYRWLLQEKFRRSVAALGDLRGQTVLTVCGGE